MISQSIRRRLTYCSKMELSLSSESQTVEPTSGSITVNVYYNGNLLKDSSVRVTYSGESISSASYSSSTGKITINYGVNEDDENSRTNIVSVTYKSLNAIFTLTQMADYIDQTYETYKDPFLLEQLGGSSWDNFNLEAYSGGGIWIRKDPSDNRYKYIDNNFSIYASFYYRLNMTYSTKVIIAYYKSGRIDDSYETETGRFTNYLSPQTNYINLTDLMRSVGIDTGRYNSTYGDAVYDSAGEYNLGDYTVTNSSANSVGYAIKDCKITVLCNSEGIPSSSGVTVSGNIEDINYRTYDGSAITLTPNSSFPVSLKIGFHSYS